MQSLFKQTSFFAFPVLGSMGENIHLSEDTELMFIIYPLVHTDANALCYAIWFERGVNVLKPWGFIIQFVNII